MFSSVVTARIYGVHVIGQFALASAAVLAVRVLSTARERPAVVREYAVLPRRAARITGLWVAVFAFSVGVTSIMAGVLAGASAWAFRGPIDNPELIAPTLFMLAGYLLLGNTGENFDTVLTSFRASRQLLWIRLHEWGAFFGTAVVLGLTLDDSVWGLAVATVAAWATPLAHRLICVRPIMRFVIPRQDVRAGFSALPGIIRFGLKITPGGIADGISNQIPTWVLGIVGSVAQVGAWGRAWMMVQSIQVLGLRINEMLLPTLVERRAAGDGIGFDRAFSDSIRYAITLLLLPAAAAGGAAASLMSIFGPGFSAAADALAILLAMLAFSVAANLQRTVLFALDRPLTASAIAGVRLAVTAVAAYLLARQFGPTGAAVAMILGYAFDSTLKAFVIHGHLSGPARRFWSAREGLGVLLAYVAGFAAARTVDSALGTIPGALVAIAAGAGTYVLVYLVVAGVNPRDRARLAGLRRRLPPPLRGPPGRGTPLGSPP